MASNYEVRKRTVNPKAAASVFSQDFATKAFERGLHKPKRDLKSGDGRPIMPPELISWITSEGRQRLAIACLAYLFALGLKRETAEDRSFVDLIRQIRDGAEKIARAADTLAEQLRQQPEAAKIVESVRYIALTELAAALNAGSLSPEDLPPAQAGGPFAGALIRHGLHNCWRLHHRADDFLSRYHHIAKVMRADGKRVLELKSGMTASEDRDNFIVDLANLYRDGTKNKASARVGSATSGYAPSPFVRFVAYVFDELRNTCSVFDVSEDIEIPSPDAIRGALNRRSRQPKIIHPCFEVASEARI